MKVIVSDTSCISNLLIIGKLQLLKNTYHNIIIPPAVFNELMALEKFGKNVDELKQASWIEIVPPTEASTKYISGFFLDRGETEAIALAYEIKADILIIDEAAGRNVARELGIYTTGLIGVLIKAKNEGFLTSVKDTLDHLVLLAGFRVSEKLYNDVLILVNEK
jgi:predicted nucleic acid-binding protein